METSIVDLAGQSANAATKAKKPASDIFGEVLARLLDRIGTSAQGEDALGESFFQAQPRSAAREPTPERAEASEAVRAERPRDERRAPDELPPFATAAVEATRETRQDRAAVGGSDDGEPGDKFHPDATAAPRVPSSPTEPGAAARVPGTLPAREAPSVSNTPPPAMSAPGSAGAAPGADGAPRQIQVTVAQAPVQAQAAATLTGKTALAAQETVAESPKASLPAGAAPVAAAAVNGELGKGGADSDGGANPNSGQPGFAGLPPGIVLANAVTGQNPGNAPGNASFAAAVDDAAVDPIGEPVLSAGLPASAAAAATAARRAAQPQAPAQLPRLTAMEQIAINIQKAIAAGKDQVTIRLRPEELGRIDVRLDVGADGQVTAQVRADKPETLELLQRDARGLERALQDAGLRTDSGALSFGLRGENGANGQAADARPAGAPAGEDIAAEDGDAIAPPALLGAANGRVDLHV